MFRFILIINVLFFSFTTWGQFNLENFEVAGKGTVNLPAAGNDEPIQSEISLGDGLTFRISVYRFSESYVYFSDAQLKNEDGYMSLDGFAIDSKSVDIDFQEYMEKNLVLKPTQKFVPMTNENSGFVAGELLDGTVQSLDIQIKILNLRTDLTRDQAKALFEKNYFMPEELSVNRFKISHLGAGGYHSCVVVNEKVKCWGRAEWGAIGSGGAQDLGVQTTQLGENLEFVDLGNFKVKQIASGGFQTCALSVDGFVKCWGDNVYGQLGLGDQNRRGTSPEHMGDNLPILDLAGDKKVIQISTGGRHACALFEDQKVKCWGGNAEGQLGLGDRRRRGDQPNEMGDNLSYLNLGTQAKPVKLAVGWEHTCALFDNGKVKCWGYSQYIGLDGKAAGATSNSMGDNLAFVDLGPEKVVDISSFYNSNCALFKNGKVKCWGANRTGLLGLEDKRPRGYRPGDMGKNLPFVELGTQEKVVKVEVGYFSTCAIFESGRVKCWGANGSGQLGYGDRIPRGGDPNTMGANLAFVNIGTEKIVDIDVGFFFTCMVDETLRLKCLGDNQHGQLGIGSRASKGYEQSQLGKALKYSDLGQSLEFD